MTKKFTLVLGAICLFNLANAGQLRLIIKMKSPNAPSANSRISAQDAKLRLLQPLSKTMLNQLSRDTNARVTYGHPIATGAQVIFVDTNSADPVASVLAKLNADPSVEHAEVDRIFTHTANITPNPSWQWDMYGFGEFVPNPSPIFQNFVGDNFTGAWQELLSANSSDPSYIPGKGTVVAVIDTGYTPHPNFLGQLEPLDSNGNYGYQIMSDCRLAGSCPASTPEAEAQINYQPNGLDLGDYTSVAAAQSINNGCAATIGASSWHGSHVTGTVIANSYTAENESYVTGGAYGAVVVPVRVLGICGGYDSDIANAIVWASGGSIPNTGSGGTAMISGSPNKADVINLSLGGAGICDSTLQQAINIANQNGSIIVAAAGNDQIDVSGFSPANCSGVVSVAARGPTNKLAYYSDFGNTTIAASGGDGNIAGCVTSNSCISKVYSTIWSSTESYQPESQGGYPTWTSYEGTSQATPHVVAALADIISYFKAKNESYTSSGVVQIITHTASTYLNYSNSSIHAGETANGGTLNVESAISYAIIYGAGSAITPNISVVNFSAVNTPVTVIFSNTRDQAITIGGVQISETSLNDAVFETSASGTCGSGLVLNPAGTSGDSCSVVISIAINTTADGVLSLIDNNGFILSSPVGLNYTAINQAPAPVAGGCSAVKNGDDMGMLLLLLASGIYVLYRRRQLTQKVKNDV